MSIIRLIHITIDPSEIEKCLTGLEEGMRTAHDPAKGLHFGKTPPLPRHA